MLLFEKEKLNTLSLGKWQQDAFQLFESKMTDKTHKFPCIPATIGFKLNHFRYGFLSDPRSDQAADELAELLSMYGEQSQAFGKYTSLIAFFETPPDIQKNYQVSDYRQLFWDVLSKVSSRDHEEWPSHIPTDPHHHVWEYCYAGEQYFMYCATPAHDHRQSRYFPYFIYAITPRWVLTEFNSNAQTAAQLKSKIRERIEAYDEVGIHPDLQSYGSQDNYEWKQYFLNDDNTSTAESKCPFAHLHLKKQS